MPLYEYECDNCGHRFEAIQKFSDPPVDKCPQCGGTVHKIQSAPAFQFKGTGWYITDYAKKDQAAGEKKERVSSDSKESGKETTEAAKPEPAEKPTAKTDAPKSEKKAASTKSET